MKRSTALQSAGWAVFGLALGSLAFLTWEWRMSGTPATTAILLCALLVTASVAWPFLLGWKPSEPTAGYRLGRARVCAECGTMNRTGARLDFCLRCGSTRTSLASAY